MNINGVSGNTSYSMDYLKGCDEQLKSYDKNNNSVTTVNEFIKGHNIQSNNYKDFAQNVNALMNENKSIFQKYAGEDDAFTTVEYVELINSSEWENINAELDKLEMQFGIGCDTTDENNPIPEMDFSLAAFRKEIPLSVMQASAETTDTLYDSTLDDTCDSLDKSLENQENPNDKEKHQMQNNDNTNGFFAFFKNLFKLPFSSNN